MITKTDIAISLKSIFKYNNKITIDGLFPILTPKNQKFFGFYLQEIITNNLHSIVCSFDVSLDPTLITIDFQVAPFRLSESYTQEQVVDKIVSVQEFATYIREKKLNIASRDFSDIIIT